MRMRLAVTGIAALLARIGAAQSAMLQPGTYAINAFSEQSGLGCIGGTTYSTNVTKTFLQYTGLGSAGSVIFDQASWRFDVSPPSQYEGGVVLTVYNLPPLPTMNGSTIWSGLYTGTRTKTDEKVDVLFGAPTVNGSTTTSAVGGSFTLTIEPVTLSSFIGDMSSQPSNSAASCSTHIAGVLTDTPVP